jgi:hypothetical protein
MNINGFRCDRNSLHSGLYYEENFLKRKHVVQTYSCDTVPEIFSILKRFFLRHFPSYFTMVENANFMRENNFASEKQCSKHYHFPTVKLRATVPSASVVKAQR